MAQADITAAQTALENFAVHLDQFWTDQPFHMAHGQPWNSLPLTRDDLSGRVRALSARLSYVSDNESSVDLVRRIKSIPDQLIWFQNQTLPHLPSGDYSTVLQNFDVLLSNVEQALPVSRLPDWEEVKNSALVPRDLARRIRNMESAIARLEPKAGSIETKLQAINEAHATATDLPTDLQSLREAREEISTYVVQSLTLLEKLANAELAATKHSKEVEQAAGSSAKLVENIEAAYSAATTVGLARAFNERANSLTQSTRLWVALLMVALVGGAAIGYIRLESFQEIVARPNTDHQIIWVNAVMSLLSIAAPVWFAWLATRQIGQRFRLAEDYAFKASVAKAYEGYRKEAARLDPLLEARLFASALDRLEEAPLRFLSAEEHGSPYESLLASAGFQKALEKIPSVRDALAAALDRVQAQSRRPAQESSQPEASG